MAFFGSSRMVSVKSAMALSYLAVMLLEKQTPDADFLDRFAAQDTEVITHAEGARREPKDRGPQTAGLYFRIESIKFGLMVAQQIRGFR